MNSRYKKVVLFNCLMLFFGWDVRPSDFADQRVVNLVVVNSADYEDGASVEHVTLDSLVKQRQIFICFNNVLNRYISTNKDLEEDGFGDEVSLREYAIKDVGKGYLLLVPQEILDQELLDVSDSDLAKIKITKEDFLLGLNFSSFPDWKQGDMYDGHASPDNFVEVFKNLSLVKFFLQGGREDLWVKSPMMNVFLIGHGLPGFGGLFMGISSIEPKESKKIKNLFYILNQQYKTRVVTILTCFGGGVINSISPSFGQDAFLENLSYPILLGSAFFAPFEVSSTQGINFIDCFKYLNHQKTYKRSQKVDKSGNKVKGALEQEYTVWDPQYKKVEDLFTSITKEYFLNNGFVTKEEYYLKNKFLIKYPNSFHWFILSDFDKSVQVLSAINAVAAKDVISVPDFIKELFLETQYIPKIIKVSGNLKELLVVPSKGRFMDFPGRVDYYIKEFQALNADGDIKTLVKVFFNDLFLAKLRQPFFILIKKVILGSKEYHNCCFYYSYETSFIRFKHISTALAMCLYQEEVDSEYKVIVALYDRKENDRSIPINWGPEEEKKMINKCKDFIVDIEQRGMGIDIDSAKRNEFQNLDAAFGDIAKNSAKGVKYVEQQQKFRAQKAKKETETMLLDALELASLLKK